MVAVADADENAHRRRSKDVMHKIHLDHITKPVKDTTFNDFCERVQVHGLVDWHKAKSHCAKGFWLLLIIFFLAVLIYGVVTSVKEYYTNPIRTSVSISPTESLPFPEVYICPTTFRDLSKDSVYKRQLEPYLRERNHTSLLGDTYSVWSQMLPFGSSGVPYDAHIVGLKPPTIGNFLEQMQTISLDVEDVIPKCEFEGQQINCSEIVHPIIDKDNGICYKVKLDRSQRTAGIGLRIIVDLNVENVGLMPPPFDGAYIAVEDTIDPFRPLPTVVGPGTYVKMDLSMQYEELITVTYSETPQLCQSDDSKREYRVLWGPYSNQFCVGDCVQAAVLKHCDCLMMIDPSFVQKKYHDEYFCTTYQVKECASKITQTAGDEILDCSRDCYKPCKSWNVHARQSAMNLGSSAALDLYEKSKDSGPMPMKRSPPDVPPEPLATYSYNVTLENGTVETRVYVPPPPVPPIDPFDARHKLQNPQYWRKSLLLLDISFGDTQFTSIVQNRAKTVAELLSDIGGQTGLWLGCSIFSLIQLVVLAAGYLYTNTEREQQHRQRQADGQTVESNH